jgi:hypothetical protein
LPVSSAVGFAWDPPSADPSCGTYPGLYVLQPLLLRPAGNASDLDAVGADVLALTKMNWNNAQLDERDPSPSAPPTGSERFSSMFRATRCLLHVGISGPPNGAKIRVRSGYRAGIARCA